ncbi:MAG: hydrogenase formation protein HypD [Pseudobdellovibrionaceae bacterium]
MTSGMTSGTAGEDTFPKIRIMEFCGGHTHALVAAGIPKILPKNLKMIHGPGCPVCVLPANHIQVLIDLLEEHPKLTIATYGDLLRIPTLKGDSLLKAQGRGKSIRILYSPLELISWAKENPLQEFIFMAVGFETTAPATALLVKKLQAQNIQNVSILCLHVLTPPAIEAVMTELTPEERPQAIIGPGHVALVMGLDPYTPISKNYHLPIVVSGFEPSDLLESIDIACDMLNKKISGVRNQYIRALRSEGNRKAQSLLQQVFNLRPTFIWRGLGELKDSALNLRPEFDPWNAEKKYQLQYRDIPEHPQCKCGDILRGKKSPNDCRLFSKACTPNSPLGACMVSSEGACHAYYQEGGAQ